MIGGRVLDTTALHDAATGRTQYLRAFISVSRDVGITLAVPTVAWQRAWRDTAPGDRPFLQLLRELTPVVFDDLTPDVAQGAALLGAGHDLDVQHVVHSALTRGWHVLTTRPDTLRSVHPDVAVEPLP